MLEAFSSQAWAGSLIAFGQVVMIDLVLAGDNAVAVGMAAAGLPEKDRRKAIVLGLGGAVIMLIGLALMVQKLLNVIGLELAGGFLLLVVCWKMWRDLHNHGDEEQRGEATLDHATPVKGRRARTLAGALVSILLADLAMSLDNVLAVAGAALGHPYVLVAGLILSVTLMGVAAAWIARFLARWRWLGYIGLAIVIYVAAQMIWQGHREVVQGIGETRAYNALMPDLFDIKPAHKP